MRLNESTPIVMQMRSEGLTYHLIAMELGVTRQRIQQIVDIAERKAKRGPAWTDGLSPRNLRLVRRLGLKDKASVAQAVTDRRIKPTGWKNYGVKSYHDLCAWAEVPPVPYHQA